MAYMCRLGFGECDACGACWDEDEDHEDECEEEEEDDV